MNQTDRACPRRVDEALQQRLRPLFFSPATPADSDAGRIASLGEGPHIGQHLSALVLREVDLPRRHVRLAVMDSLEQVGIGFLCGRRCCEVSRVRSTKKPVPVPFALRPVTTGAVPGKQGLATRHIAALGLGLSLSLRHSSE